MHHTRGQLIKTGIISVILLLCVAVVGVILTGVNQFKLGSQLASINQVSNLSHLLVRQQAKLFSLMLIKEARTDELTDALELFAQEEFVIDANLYAANGVLIAQSPNAKPFPLPQNDESVVTQQIVEPIFDQQDLVGFLRVTFDSQYAQTTQHKVNELFHLLYGELIILFLAGGVFVSCFYFFSKRSYPPINLPMKLPIRSDKSQTQRFHSRRRAFRRK